MENEINLEEGKKVYFASDFHFGIPNYQESRLREDRVCNWLKSIKEDAQVIFLLGDLFDSWMEYKTVVPKGAVRFLGTLAELSDQNIKIIVFTGNHDAWMHGYFQQELNIQVYKTPQLFKIQGKMFFIGHGDGIYHAEKKYLLLKKIIQHPLSQLLYRWIHPDIGLKIADYFSRKGLKHKEHQEESMDYDNEYQILFAKSFLQKHEINYFIFGHRHIAAEYHLNAQSIYINLGDWFEKDIFSIFDGEKIQLKIKNF